MLGEQLAQGAQPLQLAGTVEAVAGVRALGLDEPDALDVAQHARRPAGRLRRFVDREGVHDEAQPYHGCVKVLRHCAPAGVCLAGRSAGSGVVGEPRLEPVDRLDRAPGPSPLSDGEVDRHEVAEQHEREDALDRRLAARLATTCDAAAPRRR